MLWLDGGRGATCYSRLMRTRENNVITVTQRLESYLESFSEFEKLAAGHGLPWLQKLRLDALARFCEVGFPTTHDEDWRFTDVYVIPLTPLQSTPNGRRPRPPQELAPNRGP